MARKGSQPALYELIRSHPAGRGAPSLPPRTEGSHELPVSAAPPAPSRTLRVPAGYAYAAIPLALVAIVASYLYGVSVGDRMARERMGQQRVDEMNAAAQLPAVDPLVAGKLPPSLASDDDRNGSSGAIRRENPSGAGGGTPNAPQGGDLGPAPSGDPRQEGLNYFVLAHTDVRNGEGMVDFCRKNGLDAHLVPDDNAKLRLVVVLPGFAGGERQSAAVKALESKIRSVGLKWKNAARGNRDFGDAYPKKHLPKRSG